MPALTSDGLRAASLCVLTLQNTALALLLHTSRIRGASYSAATAVLLNEVFKGSISLCVAYRNCNPDSETNMSSIPLSQSPSGSMAAVRARQSEMTAADAVRKLSRLKAEVLSRDCWKLSIPAVLYVIQNNLQFVAASNLDVATFQVSYQLKILTTAIFSVVMLKKRLTRVKWTALFFLAVGVAIVQVQAASITASSSSQVEHEMHPLTGFLAVFSACITSGLAGVYFEMVLKGSTADLWVRNVQLSLFSLLPALLPALRPILVTGEGVTGMLKGFGPWAWSVVWCQVIGGLVTALVIKYSDNIVKGFATSLSIIISFASSSFLFPEEFRITLTFLVGTATVLGATFLYNHRQSISSDGSANANEYSLQATTSPSSIRESLLPISSRPSSPGGRSLSYGLSAPGSTTRLKDLFAEAIQAGGIQPRPDSPAVAAAETLPSDGRKRNAAALANHHAKAETSSVL